MAVFGVDSSDVAAIGTWFSGVVVIITVLVTIYYSQKTNRLLHNENISMLLTSERIDKTKRSLTITIQNIGNVTINLESLSIYFHGKLFNYLYVGSDKKELKMNEKKEIITIEDIDALKRELIDNIRLRKESYYSLIFGKKIKIKVRYDLTCGFKFVINTEKKNIYYKKMDKTNNTN